MEKNSVNENKDVHIELLKDTLNDLRNQNKFNKKLVFCLCAIIALLIGILTFTGVYYQYKFMDFLNEYDLSIESNITTSDTAKNDGSITVERK